VLTRETQNYKRGLLVFHYSNAKACRGCPLREQCTTGAYRRVERWEKEAVLERAETRLAAAPGMMKLRRSVVEHPFGTMKFWNNQWALQTRGTAGARTELTLSVLAYNLKRLLRLVPLSELLEKLAKAPCRRSSVPASGLRGLWKRLQPFSKAQEQLWRNFFIFSQRRCPLEATLN